ncbi:MAG: dynamin family protein [Magnetococcus sp. DMHC-6]
MFLNNSTQIERRIESLEKHLKQENPVLLRVVQSFRELDRVAYRMGLLDRSESFATRVPWWPLISILGTFSAGKSTFINSFLDQKLQRTGNQAVDDKFTVICYSKEEQSRTLPGLALDADPRFPFYQISREIEEVVTGEGRRIDAYLQLKTCPTEKLRGKILIDSPGFDADAQRTSTLKITDHIMDLSDLVLVLFDARHPEPGAMKDTLEHLVANTINRHDSNKFLFILNQVDCTVSEDNLEDVVAAWQRAMSQAGLMAGHFFQIYNKQAAHPIADDEVRTRYENKLAEDMNEILGRINRVEIDRAYRIIGSLEDITKMIQDEVVPILTEMISQWRKGVLILDGIWILLLGGLIAGATLGTGHSLGIDWFINMVNAPDTMQQTAAAGIALTTLGIVGYLHVLMRKLSAWNVTRNLTKKIQRSDILDAVRKGFKRNIRLSRSLLSSKPSGWGSWAQNRIFKVQKDTNIFVQDLNDQFTNPSGKEGVNNPKVLLDIS